VTIGQQKPFIHPKPEAIEPIPGVECKEGSIITLDSGKEQEYKTLLDMLNAAKTPTNEIKKAVRDADVEVRRKLACDKGLKRDIWKKKLQAGTFAS
jgi:propanediol dehydratase large subunit